MAADVSAGRPPAAAARRTGGGRAGDAGDAGDALVPERAVPGELAVDAAYDALYRDSYVRLVTQLVPVAGSVAEAEDVVQEAFFRAAQRWPAISRYDAPEAWIRRVALNLALSSLRRARRAAATALAWRRDLEPPTVAGPESAHLDRTLVVQAMRTLPPRYRVVLTLHYLADLDARDIAEELGLPYATVRTRLARGRRRLLAALPPEEDP
ncbi:MAG: sigma-70 family RNA polymerase sigma factor [Kineosporiaceae bacterium]